MEWFTIQQDKITGRPADVELQLYGNGKQDPLVKVLHINDRNLSIFDEQNANNSELRVRFGAQNG